MSIQIYSYGAFIRLVTDSSVLNLAKHQIKTIEVVRQDTVKISIGEGAFNETLIKLSDVTVPANLVDVAALRDTIAHMSDHANQYEVEALIKQQVQIDQLVEIKQLFNLWYSSFQIDLNFQQLQVNALVSIGNRLMEAKENEDRLISQVQEQTTEMKAQSLQLTGANHVLADLKATNENALNKQVAVLNVLNDMNVTLGLIKTISADILNELKAQTNKLSTIDTTVNDLRSQNNATHSKQDYQSQLLTEIKTVLSNPH
ncbi:hypothetical protein ACE38W_00960 [Chitinophaga sp. Hz27]|uniref:hypothetical protein n=1 Tax=Chitinophaga sp. Hz27 TaxID=3347169 RepID=UPI0035DF3802